MNKISPEQVWREYEEGVAYNQAVSLYDNVKRNEHFFIGDQWYGANAPKDLDKPVFNILKRVISYFVSILVSDDVSADISVFDGDPAYDQLLKAVDGQIEEIIENDKLKAKNRECIRNAAVDGEAYLYVRFDERAETGQTAQGMIVTEVLDNTNVIFGSPQDDDLQSQPYLIVSMRRTVKSVREEAKANGIPAEEIEQITADDEENPLHDTPERGKATVLVRFEKRNGTVYAMKTTRNVVLKQEVDLGYRLYPIAGFIWDRIKGSYHGQAAVTGMIPNQVFINKLFAMSMEHVKAMAFPKVIYNRDIIDHWTNAVGAAIGVNGPPNDAVATGFKAPDMSNQVMVMIDKVIQYTRDTMGASDAALGNIKPENTSAIIAVQKSSAMPLELQRMDYYQFVEDYIRIFVDMMRVNYGVRQVGSEADEMGNPVPVIVDFGQLTDLRLKLNVDVGASTYWSELMQVQTMDNLFAKGILTDAVTYLESIPDGYIKNKSRLIDKLQEQQNALGQQAAAGQMMGNQAESLPNYDFGGQPEL